MSEKFLGNLLEDLRQGSLPDCPICCLPALGGQLYVFSLFSYLLQVFWVSRTWIFLVFVIPASVLGLLGIAFRCFRNSC